MKMLRIYSNKIFQVTIILSVIQQILVAVSTYMILRSGEALALGDLKLVLSHIILFFIFVMLAYIPGSLSYYYLRKSQNSIWADYVNNVYLHMENYPLKNTMPNQKSIHNWLTGEAKSTIEQFCFYIKDSVDIILNILLNLSTIIYVVGPKIGISMTISLALGFLVTWLIKGKLEEFGNKIQDTKNSLFVLMDSFIDKITSLPKSSSSKLYSSLNCSLDAYFHEENRNSFLESLIPLVVTLFAISAVMYFLFNDGNLSLSTLSILVVALPRLLQIFQYLYLVIGYVQQFIFLRNKNANLINFCTKVESINHEQLINFEQIVIMNNDIVINYIDLFKLIENQKFGLYTISGSNGAGKSTLLKLIKSSIPESILITPDNNRNLGKQNLSSGQNLKQLLLEVLSKSNKQVILLDEWNANLDPCIELEIANKVYLSALHNMIIEVRHK